MSLATIFPGDIIQFTESHKWCGALAIVIEVKPVENDTKVMLGVPMLKHDEVDGTAYIYSMLSANEFEIVGKAVLAPQAGEFAEDE